MVVAILALIGVLGIIAITAAIIERDMIERFARYIVDQKVEIAKRNHDAKTTDSLLQLRALDRETHQRIEEIVRERPNED